MKVSELIEALSKLDHQDLPVMVRGYEGGVDDVSEIISIEFVRDANEAWYYGRHEPAEPGEYVSGNKNRYITEDDLEPGYQLTAN